MKRFSALILAIFLILPMTILSGCNQNTSNNDKISVVCTIFPQYDWVRQILGDKSADIDLTLLLDNKVDLHSYQPSVEDIAKVSSCDLFIYVGGESDEWVEEALKSATNKDMIVINLLEVLGDSAKEEEIKEGMEHEHEHEHEELDPDDVKDRPLSDWQGDWMTIENALASGDLDEYITHQAEQNETDFAAQKTAYTERWKSDYADLKITDKSVTFNDVSADYQYIGYKIVEGDNGDFVWYGFKADTTKEGVPSYIAFSDHGVGGEDEHEEEDAEHEETAHFHLRYGNESFEALIAMENWSPTYFPSDATGEEVAEAMGGHGHSHEGELDEHVWLSLKNAQIFCPVIADALSSLNAENADIYKSNLTAYNEKLSTLDAEYQSAVGAASVKTLLFGDRFPFRYLVDDYGLEYYTAFSGCSAETEASFETIIFLAGKADELGLENIVVTESSDQSIAKTVKNNTTEKNQQIHVLDSMQSVSRSDITDGMTYLSVMESNLNVLKDALK